MQVKKTGSTRLLAANVNFYFQAHFIVRLAMGILSTLHGILAVMQGFLFCGQ